MPHDQVTEAVKTYYGKVLGSSQDLKTTACCSTEALPMLHRKILGELDDEILAKFYGCGSPIPTTLEGARVLDLGCGTGRDVFLASKLVGPSGFVIGVDMTEEQLEVGRRHLPAMMGKFGMARPNVEFKQGYIEDLAGLGIEDGSIDVVISNCVVNLSPDKPRVLAEIFRVLKPGGELYFSDVFADRRIDPALREDETLYGECLAGALYTEDFRRHLQQLGCPDARVFASGPIDVTDPDLAAMVGHIRFTSHTMRAFKLTSLEDRCEDYGQVATYLGGVPEMPQAFVLDDHHTFVRGKPELVCGNTAAMLQETRLAAHFKIQGDRTHHFGLFDCGPQPTSAPAGASGACC